MPVHMVGISLWRHQCHVVKRSEEDAAVHGMKMHETLEFKVHCVVRLLPVFRFWPKHIFRAASEPSHGPWQFRIADRFRDAGPPPLSHGDHPIESLLRENLGES